MFSYLMIPYYKTTFYYYLLLLKSTGISILCYALHATLTVFIHTVK